MEKSNIDINLRKKTDLSDHTSERLRRMAMLGRKPRSDREGSHSGSMIMLQRPHHQWKIDI